MMKSAACGRLNALHGCLAALSGERLLLRDFTEVVLPLSTHMMSRRHSWYLRLPKKMWHIATNTANNPAAIQRHTTIM